MNIKLKLGIISYSIAIIVLVVCFFTATDLIFRKNFVLSDFGVDSRTALIFNTGLIISAVVNVFYLFFLKTTSKVLGKSIVPFMLLVVASLSLAGIGFFPYSINVQIHWLFATGFFFLYPLGIVALGLTRRKFLLIAAGLLNIFGVILLWRYIEPHAIAEIYAVVITALYVIAIKVLATKPTTFH